MPKKTIPGFVDVFERRIDRVKARVKQELAKDKSLRNRKLLKILLHDARKLKRTIREVRAEHIKRCPHCGHRL
jgi:hypothetical protein